jgi:hypothetical protein
MKTSAYSGWNAQILALTLQPFELHARDLESKAFVIGYVPKIRGAFSKNRDFGGCEDLRVWVN